MAFVSAYLTMLSAYINILNGIIMLIPEELFHVA
jgi:hypothetical protein